MKIRNVRKLKKIIWMRKNSECKEFFLIGLKNCGLIQYGLKKIQNVKEIWKNLYGLNKNSKLKKIQQKIV